MLRLTLIVLLSVSLAAVPDKGSGMDNDYGLGFVSHEDIKDNRTRLLLTPDHDLRLGGEFTLSFDVRFRPGLHAFGYVFRVIADDHANLDMVTDIVAADPKIRFVAGQRTVAEFSTLEFPGPVFGRWIKVKVALDPHDDRITLSVDGIEQTVDFEFDFSRYGIWFGACDHPAFYTTDLPPMSLRDVVVTDGRGKTLRHWKLDRHAGNIVLDETGRHPADALNPVWLLDRHAIWQKKIGSVIPEPYLAMAADGDSGMIWFAAGSRLAIYNNSGPSLSQSALATPMPFTMLPGQIMFDPAGDRLVAYEFDSRRTATLSPAERRWSPDTPPVSPIARYWHHNAVRDPASGRIITFGGYGEHTYKSRMDLIGPDGEWETRSSVSGPPPRYLSGAVLAPDGSLIVAGGYGNRSGRQSEFPHNLYDIWRIDPATGAADSLAAIVRGDDDDHFVVGRDMILSDDGKTLYALVYNDKHYATELQLAGIDLATGEMVRLADTVPYKFSDVESFCTLVFDRARNEFLAVTMNQIAGEGTLLEVWSLAAPPLRLADTIQPGRGGAWWRLWLWVTMGLVIAMGTVMAVIGPRLLTRRRRRRASSHTPASFTGAAGVPVVVEHNTPYRVEKRPSSILLLGGFQVVDRAGNDITGQFTQTVRAVFLLILLETCKNGRGISSHALSDILWLDKDPDNARNNRNVNIHKLRSLLAEVGSAEVSSRNSYWKLELGGDVFCDYATLLEESRRLKQQQGDGAADIEKLVALASLGKLLPGTQTEWSDGYKADFSARLIELLMGIASHPGMENDPALQLRIAEAVLTHDNLDEDAMRLKCRALVRMGKKNQAKQEYNHFVADFKKTLDSLPDFSFNDTLR